MGSILTPSAKSVDELRAAAIGLRLLPRNIRNDLNKNRRAVLNPMWKEAVNARAVTTLDKLVLAKGARVAPGNPATAMAATSKRPLSGGLVPDNRDQAVAIEFGTPERQAVETYTRKSRKSGKQHKVTRHTKRQLPVIQRKGRVIYAAWRDIAPRIISLDAQTIARRIYEAFEGKAQ
ncbi:hypothetical protein QEX66_gp11 [Arthrobacter phage Corgi]|uniref:Uncharacterized protein n=1 Tax=Arthrobacter phage Corgi TaxID=2419952 RepID=A0A3G2KEZ7_9CAUD|nr:hypothetical protein QEX66_gp11 [Arthrobacter phage Corgi]AYN57559.1 hypothetical protein PBI_CORGI_11 [Arthrobacter phage Corgi]